MLKRMNRRNDTVGFAALLQRIKKIMPDAAIGTDIILGLPGESDEMFYETSEFVRNLPIAYAHVFPYSKRKGTAAATMSCQIKHSIAKQRCRIITEIIEAKKEKYIDYLINEKIVLSGIIESERSDYKTALSDHYVRIYLKSNKLKENDIVTHTAVSRLFDGVLVSNY